MLRIFIDILAEQSEVIAEPAFNGLQSTSDACDRSQLKQNAKTADKNFGFVHSINFSFKKYSKLLNNEELSMIVLNSVQNCSILFNIEELSMFFLHICSNHCSKPHLFSN